MIYQNVWDAAEPVLREKSTALSAYIRKEERCQINNLSFYFKRKKNKTLFKHARGKN